jgi:plasmid stability protein
MATLNVKNFPDELYAALRERAGREHRSIAQQIVHMLEAALGPANRRSILALRGLGREAWADVDANDHVRAERDAWEAKSAEREP